MVKGLCSLKRVAIAGILEAKPQADADIEILVTYSLCRIFHVFVEK